MKRTITTAVSLAVLFTAAPAGADEGWYAAAKGGAARVDIDIDGLGNVETNTAFVGSGALGYVSRTGFGAEVDFGYHRANISEEGRDGHVRALTALVNGFYEFETAGGLQPHVGVGVGVMNLDVELNTTGLFFDDETRADDDDLTLAYSGIAGVRYDLQNSGIKLTAQYRFVGTGEADIGGLPGETSTEIHVLEAGIRLPF